MNTKVSIDVEMSFSTHCFCPQVSTPYCNHEACVSVVPFRIVGRSISHVDKSTAQWAKCMSPSSPSAAPTPAVCLSDTTRTDVIWCHFKRRISFIPLFGPAGQGVRPTTKRRKAPRAGGELRAVHRGTDWRRQGGSGRAGVRCGDHMPRLTAPSEIHSREKIPAWHPDN